MTFHDRVRYRDALVDMIVEMGVSIHAVAELPPGSPESALAADLKQWAARIDRRYLGRSWASRCPITERMSGVFFFEKGKRAGFPHAHLALRPPKGVSAIRFLHDARWFFMPHPVRMFHGVLPNPVTRRGKMWLREIAEHPGEAQKLARYITKDLEWSDNAINGWQLIANLSGK